MTTHKCIHLNIEIEIERATRYNQSTINPRIMKLNNVQTPEWLHDINSYNDHQLINNTKNQTRLNSILGTWTLESNMKASAFNTKIKTHFIMHLTCNSQYQGCTLSDCSELNNQVCVLSSDSKPSCQNMNTTEVGNFSSYFYLPI